MAVTAGTPMASDRERTWLVSSSLALAAVVVAPKVCQAHSLTPTFAPLGPYGLVLLASPVALAAAVGLVVLHAVILKGLFPTVPFPGSLWRAAVLFVGSKIAESIPGIMTAGLAWHASSFGEVALVPAMLWTAGWAANLLLIHLLFRGDLPTAPRVILGASLLSATTYAGLFAVLWVAPL